MKTDLLHIVNVEQKFNELSKKRYHNWGVSLKLSKALREIRENKEIYIEKERELINQYVLKDENGQFKIVNNQPQFESVEKAEEFQKELNNLQHTEIDIFDPIHISINDFKFSEDALTPSDILALEPFVVFDEPEEESK